MPQHDERSVRIDHCLVVWDGITRPEPMDGGGQKYNIKVVVPPNSPDIPVLEHLGNTALQQSEFKGQLPNGAHWIIGQAGPNEFGGGFHGWLVVNGITYQPPQVFDEQGQELQAMQYGQLLYPGQTVNILVSAKAYNNVSKGVKAQLEGFQIVASANSPRLNIGAGGNAAAAFGGAPAGGYQQPAGQPGGYQQPAGQPGGYQQPAGQPGYGGAPAGGPPANPTGAAPAPGAAAQGPGAGTGAPGGAMTATAYPSNPQQQHNYLPPQG